MTEEKKCDTTKAAAAGILLGLPVAAILSNVLDEESALSRAYKWVKTRVVEPKIDGEAAKLERERLVGRPRFV